MTKSQKNGSHLNGNVMGNHTADSRTSLDKPSKQTNFFSSKSFKAVPVKKTSSIQKLQKETHVCCSPADNSNRLSAAKDKRDIDKVKLNKMTKLVTPTEGKHTIKATSKSQTQTQILVPSLNKKVHSSVIKKNIDVSLNDTSASVVKNDESTDKKHRKRKINSKKNQDGASNWMKLCTTLKIDAAVRKMKPIKRPVTDISSEQVEHSDPKRVKSGIWFDNVDKILIEADVLEKDVAESRAVGGHKVAEQDTDDKLVKPDSFKGVTNCLAIDCEMVGVGPNGEDSILARVSVVNHFGVCLYDKFVLPREKVTDYRTYVSGVTAENLATGEQFTKVQSEISNLIKGRILVGHAVHNDLKVLFLTHPHKMIRDTSLYKPFRELFGKRLPSLKKLTEKVLGVRVQEGQHSSVQDAQATMRLYTMYRQKWEKELRKERKMDRRRKKKKNKKEITV